ncbi:chorismate lyase [Alkalimonas sp.]|uniref:chorismate--pyruvate lyase family protein n=1 Tax=Alkalimonas sp. TaxID=1872453 RepID=UPI00263A6E63|nr:chorismate lyase [Alkalimonas sp.]MCC5827138.1 chorismate lyase [Alkalimonas sp.]
MPITTAHYLLQAHWQTPAALRLLPEQCSWLLETDSLTARLKSRCQQFRLQMLTEQFHPLPEALHAQLTGAEDALLREVLLYCDEQAMIYAQSWLPASTLTAIEPLARLGSQPLGEFIFRHPALQRGPIEVAELDTAELTLPLPLTEPTLWARRSVFWLAEHPLHVVEVFMPEVYRL